MFLFLSVLTTWELAEFDSCPKEFLDFIQRTSGGCYELVGMAQSGGLLTRAVPIWRQE
jgi:hypothetical protein